MLRTRLASQSLFIALFCSAFAPLQAEEYAHRIEAKASVITYADSFKVSRYQFITDGHEQEHLVLNYQVGDRLKLTVVNQLSFEIGFSNNGGFGKSVSIPAGDSAQVVWELTKTGYCKIYDHVSAHGAYMGLTGVLLSHAEKNEKSFFMWDLSDFEWAVNEAIAKEDVPDFSTYRPDFFTINGKVYPDSESDPLVKITGNVDDVITLVIINSGRAAYSLHFHGYHVKVLSTKGRKLIEGASKDTVPIEVNEVMVLEMVPDKPGEYPVHNHALSGVISSGLYPSGQFSIMSIGN